MSRKTVLPVVFVRPVRSAVWFVNAMTGFAIVSTGAPNPPPLLTVRVIEVGPLAGLGFATQKLIWTAVYLLVSIVKSMNWPAVL